MWSARQPASALQGVSQEAEGLKSGPRKRLGKRPANAPRVRVNTRARISPRACVRPSMQSDHNAVDISDDRVEFFREPRGIVRLAGQFQLGRQNRELRKPIPSARAFELMGL